LNKPLALTKSTLKVRDSVFSLAILFVLEMKSPIRPSNMWIYQLQYQVSHIKSSQSIILVGMGLLVMHLHENPKMTILITSL